MFYRIYLKRINYKSVKFSTNMFTTIDSYFRNMSILYL